jgi:hypothetical protein
MALSEKSRAILEAIAKGHTYEQILVQDLAWTYQDIFQAVAEALRLADAAGRGHVASPRYHERTEEIRKVYPRAYEKWTLEEDQRLRKLFCLRQLHGVFGACFSTSAKRDQE